MAYVKNIWVDQDVERPKTYEVTNNQDGSITLTDSFGLVTELGTPVNAANMNHIEDGLVDTDVTKYNATTTYNAGEWVTGVVDNEKGIYASKVNNNTGNALTNDTYWEKVELGGTSRNIGEIVASTIPLTDAGLHLLDGALISGSGSYSAFVDYIADLYDSGDYDDIFETEANWQQAVTNYGVCGKFVYDSINNTVRLPKITGFIEGTTDLTVLGDLVEAGLPNITGTFNGDYINRNSGAFYTDQSSVSGNGGSGEDAIIGFDASLSNPIYGNSNTVQPQAIKVLYYIVIATSAKTDIQVDIDEIATDLNGKADTDLSNVPTSKAILEESYVNGTSWYRVYSDGWCEQGNFSGNFTSNSSVALLKNYKDTNYGVVIMRNSVTTISTTTGGDWWVRERTTSSFKPYTSQLSSPPYTCNWKAYGYIR
jgi:hypothetical protein